MSEISGKLAGLFKRYKYVLLVLAVGIVLLVWPNGGGPASDTPRNTAEAAYETFAVDQLEARLADALSSIKGVGRTRVVLTLKTDMEVLLSKDVSENQHREMDNGNLKSYDYQTDSKTVLQNGSDGNDPVVVGRLYPQFMGALIVCEGAGDKAVQLRVVEAVSALTGLGADKITVAAMQQ